MAKIFNLFGASKREPDYDFGREDERRPSVSVVKNTIRYDRELIPQLKHDHGRLVEQFTALQPLLQAGDIKGFKEKLGRFKTDFQAHIIKENVKFYVYMEQSLSHSEVDLELIRDFRVEMNAISRAVVNFCNKYVNDPMTSLGQAAFAREAQSIAQALLNRIEREERDLYVLYHDLA